MARRRSRKTKGSAKILLPMVIGGMVLLAGVGFFFASPSVKRSSGKPQEFSIREYRNDGSRMAVPGNRYFLEGRVENIETIGNSRIVAVSLKNNRNERLPLLVRKDTVLKVNLTRKDSFLFEVECRTGRDASGNEVKGILIVKNADSTK